MLYNFPTSVSGIPNFDRGLEFFKLGPPEEEYPSAPRLRLSGVNTMLTGMDKVVGQ